MNERVCLYQIGDFAGFVEHVVRSVGDEPMWHLVQISDHLNSADVKLLKRVGIEFYRPLMRSMKLVPRKHLSQAQRRQQVRPLREKLDPLFPGYAFLNLPQSDDERWREVFRMTNIRGLVCANNQPVEASEIIAQIQAREVDGAVPSATKLVELPYFVGSRVRVTEGPFRSFGGTIEQLPTVTEADLDNRTLDELDDSHRVHLLIDIFGRQTPLSLPLSDIVPV